MLKKKVFGKTRQNLASFLLFEKCNEKDIGKCERAEYNKLRPTEIQSLMKGNYIALRFRIIF